MPNRDAGAIALESLAIFLCEESGIPSGTNGANRHVWLQYANNDYVNERTFQSFPSLGISEIGKTRIRYQNYGCTQRGAENADGSYRIYNPLGEKIMMVEVDLWCETQSQRRTYKNLIETALTENTFIPTSYASDPVTGEYIRVNFMDYELSEDKPFAVHFFLEVTVPFFKEEDAYIVNQVEVNSIIGQELDLSSSWSASGNPWIVVNSSGVFITGEPGLNT
jgi:hypothetical protein